MNIRKVQADKVTTMPAAITIKTGFSSVFVPIGLPRAAPASSQGISPTLAAAAHNPPGLLANAGPMRPRTNHANAVVMPHVGQLEPVKARNAHGGKPSF